MQVSKAFANRFVEMTLTSGIWPQQSSITVAILQHFFHYADWILYPRRGEKLKLTGNKIELKFASTNWNLYCVTYSISYRYY